MEHVINSSDETDRNIIEEDTLWTLWRNLTKSVNVISLTIVLRRHPGKMLKVFMIRHQIKVIHVKNMRLALNVWTVLFCTCLECMELQAQHSLILVS